MKKIFFLLVYFSPILLQAQVSGNIPSAVNVNSNDISALMKDIKVISENIKLIGDNIKSLQAALKTQKSAVAAATQERDKIQKDIKSLGDNENRSESETANLAKLNLQLTQFNSRIVQLNKDIENTQRVIEQQVAEINVLEESLDKLEQKIVAAANKEKSEGKASQKTDSIISAERISFYIRATKLLQADPSIRAGLTPAELKTLTAFENKYKSDNIFKAEVDKVRQEKSEDNLKENSNSAVDRKKAQQDTLKKYLELLRSMNPNI